MTRLDLSVDPDLDLYAALHPLVWPSATEWELRAAACWCYVAATRAWNRWTEAAWTVLLENGPYYSDPNGQFDIYFTFFLVKICHCMIKECVFVAFGYQFDMDMVRVRWGRLERRTHD